MSKFALLKLQELGICEEGGTVLCSTQNSLPLCLIEFGNSVKVIYEFFLIEATLARYTRKQNVFAGMFPAGM